MYRIIFGLNNDRCFFMKDIYSVFNILWKQTAKSDAKTHAGQVKPDGVKEENDFYYIDDGNHYHKLDVYYPDNEGEKFSVIIDIHGGGWMYADKELNKMYCLNLAKKGYTVFNISYRLVPETTVPGQLQDIAVALKWIGEHLSDFPCEEGKILLTGDSAGGQLAVYSAILASDAHLREVFGVCDCGLKFNALALTHPVPFMDSPVMGLYCRFMWGKNYKNIPQRKYMNVDQIIDCGVVPPTFMITSSGDFLALKQTRRLYKLYASHGLKAQLMDWPKYNGVDLPHVFSVLEPHKPESQRAIDAMLRFYNRYI